jgi:hypothetical protein
VLVVSTDNAHIPLRRRVAKRLGRSISDAAWALAIDQHYVAEASDPALGSAAEDSLSRFLASLLKVQEAAARSRSRSRSTSARTRNVSGSSARIEALSRLAADHAAGDDEILQFRRRVLGRDTPMSAVEAEAYLELAEAREPRRPRSGLRGPSEVLRYQNRRIDHDLHVWSGSPLDELRKLAESLSRSYPWEPSQAAAFVLEGLIPRATPFMLRLPQRFGDGRPHRAKLIMEVDLWMPAAAVLRAYRQIQREVLPGHNRPVSARSIEVVNFVMRHQPETWTNLTGRWNNEHPDHAYANYRNFRYAFDRARRSLLHPKYRPWLGDSD